MPNYRVRKMNITLKCQAPGCTEEKEHEIFARDGQFEDGTTVKDCCNPHFIEMMQVFGGRFNQIFEVS